MNKITQLFGIKYPIIQGGMAWNSGFRLASAVSNAGGLGLIGASSMYPDTIVEHIRKCKRATNKPFGVNIPIFYPDIERAMEIMVEEKIEIVFTSAGNPSIWTSYLQDHGIKVAHVVSSTKFAQKAFDSGVDAVVAEGFEAGGHNGREETTTFALIPSIAKHIDKPLIAAGGIATGRGMYAAMALGADGVQIGTRFVATIESSSHSSFKNLIVEKGEGDTVLTLKELTPTRLIKNKFYSELEELYKTAPTVGQIRDFVGIRRAKLGMLLGDLDCGKLEIGQIISLIDQIKPVADIFDDILAEFKQVQTEMSEIDFDK